MATITNKSPKQDRLETVDDLAHKLGSAEKPPTPPPEGIPKQWLPGWVRWPIRLCIVPLLWIDLFAQKLARFFIKPPYRKVGQCKKRGNCCHAILVPEKDGIMGYIQWFWLTQIDGFYQRDLPPVDDEGEEMIVMSCRYLKQDGKCCHYFLRPMICRQWPIIERFGLPQILPGCGYQAVLRKQKQLKKEVKKDLSR